MHVYICIICFDSEFYSWYSITFHIRSLKTKTQLTICLGDSNFYQNDLITWYLDCFSTVTVGYFLHHCITFPDLLCWSVIIRPLEVSVAQRLQSMNLNTWYMMVDLKVLDYHKWCKKLNSEALKCPSNTATSLKLISSPNASFTI